jgi:probable phosphoglycerate mutase
MADEERHDVVLVRHGETEWSLSGRHTGVTDIPLTGHGREQAAALEGPLARWSFALVLASPRQRARDTCALALPAAHAVITDDLAEWDYGEYEGRTTSAIRESVPGWTIFDGGAPGGETPEQVAARADRVLARARDADGDVALFAHGHILRVVAARWLGLDARDGRLLALDAATLSVLGWEREQPVLRLWNERATANGDEIER